MKAGDPSESITRASASNLALAFVALDRARRRAISVFYAFCRLVDDLGDAGSLTLEERAAGLDLWERALGGPQPGESPVAAAAREVFARYGVDPLLPKAIIEGVRMDLAGTRYETWEDLERYCWHVASAVGLVSVEIFGYTQARTREYAAKLGLALQLTNILRDVGVDYRENRRIYLPLREMAERGVAEADIAAARHTPGFAALMAFQGERAARLFAEADAVLPGEDRKSMSAARIMRRVYGQLLGRMRRDGFRVFEKGYRVPALEKAAAVASVWLRDSWGR